MTHNMMPS